MTVIVDIQASFPIDQAKANAADLTAALSQLEQQSTQISAALSQVGSNSDLSTLTPQITATTSALTDAKSAIQGTTTATDALAAAEQSAASKMAVSEQTVQSLVSALQANTQATVANTQAAQQASQGHQQHAQSAGVLSEVMGVLTEHLQAAGVPMGQLGGFASRSREGLSQMAEGMSGGTEAAGLLAAGMASLAVAGFAAAAAAADEATSRFVELADKVREASEMSGISETNVQALMLGMGELGQSSDGAARALTIFERNSTTLSDALRDGTAPPKAMANALADLGIKMEDFISMSPDERLAAVMDGFQRTASSANGAADAMALFSRNGATLLPILREGSGGLSELKNKVADAGSSVEDAQTSVLGLHKAVADLGNDMSGMDKIISGGVVPALTDLTNKLGDVTLGVDHAASGIGHFFDGLGDKAKAEFQKIVESIPGMDKLPVQFGSIATSADLATAAAEKNAEATKTASAAANQYATALLSVVQEDVAARLKATAGNLGEVAEQQNLFSAALRSGGNATDAAAEATDKYGQKLKGTGLQQATTDLQAYDALVKAMGPAAAQSWFTQQAAMDQSAASLQRIQSESHNATDLLQSLNQALRDGSLNADDYATGLTKVHSEALAQIQADGPETLKALQDINKEMKDGTLDAKDYLKALEGVLGNPTQGENANSAVIEQNKASIASWNATVANSSPIDQRIAKLVEQQDAEIRTGASQKQQQQTTRDLNDQLAAVSATEGQTIVAGQHHADQVGITTTALEAQNTALAAQRTAMDASLKATEPNVAKMSDLQTAVQNATRSIQTANTDTQGPLATIATGFDGVTTAAEKTGTTIDGLPARAKTALAAIASAMPSFAGIANSSGPSGIPSLLGSPVGGAGTGGSGPLPTFPATGGGDTSSQPAAMSGGRLPASWYAAIQANESTLPLPSPGSPQPMFGIIPEAAHGFSVGTGYYSSGGTAEASASLGVGAGQTRQALFPSVDAGEQALDALWSQYPDVVAAAQSGDFGGFLSALAPRYAGPGEVQRWPAQVLSHYSQGAGLVGGGGGGSSAPSSGGGFGTPGQNPVPAPDTTAASNAAPPDTSSTDAKLDQLQQKMSALQALTLQVNAGLFPPSLTQSVQAFTDAIAPIEGDWQAAKTAVQAYDAYVQSGGTDAKTLATERQAANDALKALSDDETKAEAAGKTLNTNLNDQTSATKTLATEQGQLAIVTASGQTSASAAVQHTATTFEQMAQTAIAAQQRVIDDTTNNVAPAIIEADRAIATADTDAANTSYQAWQQASQQAQAATAAVVAAAQNGAKDLTGLQDALVGGYKEQWQDVTQQQLTLDQQSFTQKQTNAVQLALQQQGLDRQQLAAAQALKAATDSGDQAAIVGAQARLQAATAAANANRQLASEALAAENAAGQRVTSDTDALTKQGQAAHTNAQQAERDASAVSQAQSQLNAAQAQYNQLLGTGASEAQRVAATSAIVAAGQHLSAVEQVQAEHGAAAQAGTGSAAAGQAANLALTQALAALQAAVGPGGTLPASVTSALSAAGLSGILPGFTTGTDAGSIADSLTAPSSDLTSSATALHGSALDLTSAANALRGVASSGGGGVAAGSAGFGGGSSPLFGFSGRANAPGGFGGAVGPVGFGGDGTPLFSVSGTASQPTAATGLSNPTAGFGGGTGSSLFGFGGRATVPGGFGGGPSSPDTSPLLNVSGASAASDSFATLTQNVIAAANAARVADAQYNDTAANVAALGTAANSATSATSGPAIASQNSGGGGGSQFGTGEAAWNQQVQEAQKAMKTPNTSNTSDPSMPYFYSLAFGNLLPNPNYNPNYHPEGPRAISLDLAFGGQHLATFADEMVTGPQLLRPSK